jgi:hypothetical protein
MESQRQDTHEMPSKNKQEFSCAFARHGIRASEILPNSTCSSGRCGLARLQGHAMYYDDYDKWWFAILIAWALILVATGLLVIYA